MYKKARIYRYITLGLALTLVLGAIAALFIDSMSNMVEQDTTVALQAIANQSALKIRTTMLDELAALQRQSDFIGAYENIHDPEIIEILSKGTSEYRYIRSGVLLPDGTSLNTDETELNLAHREYFQRAMKGESIISDILVNMVDNTSGVIVFAVPIWKGEEVVGVLRGVHETSNYADMLDMSLLGSDGHAHVVRVDGTLILASGKISSHPLFSGKPFSADSRITDNLEFAKMATDMTEGKSGLVELPITKNNFSYVDYRPLGINDWYLVSTIPSTAVLQRVMSVLRIASGASLMLLIVFLYVVISLVVAKDRKEAALEQIAFTDPVTGLDNWERLRYSIGQHVWQNRLKGFSYIVVKIDTFRVISEVIGFVAANNLLKRIGMVLAHGIRQEEYVLRVENDRFALLLHAETENKVKVRIHAMQQQLSAMQEDNEFKIAKGRQLIFNFGVIVIDATMKTLEEIHEMASATLDSAAPTQKDAIIFYNQTLHLGIRQRKELELRFDTAIEHGEFTVFFQPIVDVHSKEVKAMEALVRWDHPIRGMLPPIEYIPFLEKNGKIRLLDRWVFRYVCQLQRDRKERALVPIKISVNVSRPHLLAPDFFDTYVAITKEYQVNPSDFYLELTESTFIDTFDRIQEILKQLAIQGFNIAIDDFGSGFSSLNLLYDLPATIVKIDRKFLVDLNDREKSDAVLRHILQMIDEMGIKAVAEGVETAYQFKYLQTAGCPMAQGFYFAKPLPAEQAFTMID